MLFSFCNSIDNTPGAGVRYNFNDKHKILKPMLSGLFTQK
jgi:hypothetical protein